MSSFGNNHLTDKQLLFYVDGELVSRESAGVRKHLESCWACRAKLEDLERAIKKIVEFHDQVLLPMIPPPPRHWEGLEPRLRELDERREMRTVGERLRSLFRSSLLEPRYTVSAVLVLAALGALVWLPSQPVISANELLARVQAAQSAEFGKVTAPVVHQRLRVRRKLAGSIEQAAADYDSWEDRSRGQFREAGSSAEILTEFRTICDANQLDWQTPLSAAGFARWRDSLPTRQDIIAPVRPPTVANENVGSGPLALTTIARSRAPNGLRSDDSSANRITQAELIVRTADWHPVEERLWVNDREYEIAELDYRVLPRSEVDGEIFAEPPAPVEPVGAPHPKLAEAPAPPVPAPPDPEETEMAVRYELHQLDADLGEPIEISRDSQGKVMVEAAGVRTDLQAKLKQQLALIPNTALKLDRTSQPACKGCPAPPSAMPETDSKPPAPALSIVPAVNPNEKRLEEIFGDPHAQESFTREVLAASSDALSRGFALRDLALRYPPEEEAKLSTQAGKQLQEMVDDHIAGLVEPANLLQGLLRPLLEVLSNRDAAGAGLADDTALSPPPAGAGKSLGKEPDGGVTDDAPQAVYQWQSASLQIFASVQKADRMIKGLLTSTNTAIPAQQVVPELRKALAQQQHELNGYQERVQQAEKTPEK